MRLLKYFFIEYSKIKLRLYRATMIYAFNSLKGCSISKGVVINKPSSFTNVAIGFGTYLSINARISNSEIGKFCSIGPNLLCGFGIHPINGISTCPSFYSTEKQNGFTFCSINKIKERQKIFIGNDVFIGANVTIIDGVIIGDGAIIGAGAVVSKNIPPYAIAVGCPIKIIKYRFDKNTIDKMIKIKWWNMDKMAWLKVEKYFFNIEEFLENI